MWSAKINASTAKYEAPDEVDPVVTLRTEDRWSRLMKRWLLVLGREVGAASAPVLGESSGPAS